MKRVRSVLGRIAIPLALLLLALFLAALLILCTGHNPITAFGALFIGAFGSFDAIINTINKSVPICIAAFAVGIASKVGVFNIGVEGQLLIGAFGATIAGIYIKGLPAIIHIPICIASGMLFGAAWAFLPSFLYVRRNTNLLIANILMNSVSKLMLTFLIMGPFAGPVVVVPSTDSIEPSAQLPLLIDSTSQLSIAVLIMLATAVILHTYLYKTTFGFELRAVGLNRAASDYVGIHSKRYSLLALLGGGMLAGLAGSLEILGNYHLLYDSFSPGYGFDGIPIALLANGNPYGCIVGGLLFGALRAGAQNMQIVTGVNKEIVTVIQGLLVTLIGAEFMIRYFLKKLSFRKVGSKT